MTTGVSNTLMGGLTGDALTGGNYNVALGQGSLTVDTNGNKTVAIGTFALANQNLATAASNAVDSSLTALIKIGMTLPTPTT